jgi:hypothetical protein
MFSVPKSCLVKNPDGPTKRQDPVGQVALHTEGSHFGILGGGSKQNVPVPRVTVQEIYIFNIQKKL